MSQAPIPAWADRLREGLSLARRRDISEWLAWPLIQLLAMRWRTRLALLAVLVAAFFGVRALERSLSASKPAVLSAAALKSDDDKAEIDTPYLRAKAFTEAWAANDLARAVQFVDPASAGLWTQWTAAQIPPTAIAARPPGKRQVSTIGLENFQPGTKIVSTMIGARSSVVIDTQNPIIIQRQMWVKRGAEWFFVPQGLPAHRPFPDDPDK